MGKQDSYVLICVAQLPLSVLVQSEKNNKDDPKEATVVKLYMQIPPIEKMDPTLSTLSKCEWVIE